MIDNLKELLCWKDQAQPGAVMVYLQARIGLEAPYDDAGSCAPAMDAARELYATGWFDLLQRRVSDDGTFDYLIRRRSTQAAPRFDEGHLPVSPRPARKRAAA